MDILYNLNSKIIIIKMPITAIAVLFFGLETVNVDG